MCLFNNKSPVPAPPPPPVDATNSQSDAYAKSADAQAKKAALAKGQSSTILTSALGDTSIAPTNKKSLLGQ